MGTFWHKPAYTRADHDETGKIRADALRPGIYCEDQAALDQLRRGARVRSRGAEAASARRTWALEGRCWAPERAGGADFRGRDDLDA